MRTNNLPVNGTVDKEKAIRYAKELQIEGFKASNGWFERWKSRCDLKDIYNADEFGLFYQALPTKTMELKGEKCTGGKKRFISCFLLSLQLLF